MTFIGRDGRLKMNARHHRCVRQCRPGVNRLRVIHLRLLRVKKAEARYSVAPMARCNAASMVGCNAARCIAVRCSLALGRRFRCMGAAEPVVDSCSAGEPDSFRRSWGEYTIVRSWFAVGCSGGCRWMEVRTAAVPRSDASRSALAIR